MNTERDNFYDWSKDKPDTGYAAFESTRQPLEPLPRSIPWRRIAWTIALGVVVGVLLRYLSVH